MKFAALIWNLFFILYCSISDTTVLQQNIVSFEIPHGLTENSVIQISLEILIDPGN